jgi:hypothetical protein
MKKFIFTLLSISLMVFAKAQDDLPPYFGTSVERELNQLKDEVQNTIDESGYDIVGSYHVAGKSRLFVIAFSSEELKSLCSDYNDRGALASVLKVGLYENDGKTEISLLNPSYMFYAYFGEDYKLHQDALDAIDKHIKDVIAQNYGPLTSFGGGLTAEKLGKYRYKIMMPYFDDPVELEDYSDFDDGLSFIRNKIEASSDDIKLIYEVVDESKQTAVFGIALLNEEKGEPHFLPIIGERHIAAMPYEIILQYNKASMLAGKYRFALYWPELTMGEFMKIMSTPGDVEDAMRSITEQN